MAEPKTLRRNNPEYQALKAVKASYNGALRSLFGNIPNWKKLSESMGIRNVPTLIDDRLKLQAEVKRKLQKAS
jgi:hypothetical protein